MSLTSRNALTAYSQVGLDAKVAAASPHGLITMLFEGAISAVTKARYLTMEVDSGDKTPQLIADKGLAVSKAIAIIEDGLKASLNLEIGGELATNLSDLYEYLGRRLIEANLNNNVAILDEVSHRLTELKEAWQSIELRQGHGGPASIGAPTINASGVVTYGRV